MLLVENLEIWKVSALRGECVRGCEVSRYRQLLRKLNMKEDTVQQLEGGKYLKHFDFCVLQMHETETCS